MSKNRHHKSNPANESSKKEPDGATGSDACEQPIPSHNNPKPPNWVEKWTLGVLTLTLIAAGYAGFEARRLADLTEHLITDGRQSSERQLRAYVSIDKASVAAIGHTLRAVIELRNSGQTPAHDLTTRTRVSTHAAGEVFIPPPLGDAELSKMIVGPGTIVSPESELEIPADNTAVLTALQNGTAVIYVFGRTEYRDVFDKPRHLDFRLRSVRVENGRWILKPTPNGNEGN
jgi:hypothetical protein